MMERSMGRNMERKCETCRFAVKSPRENRTSEYETLVWFMYPRLHPQTSGSYIVDVGDDKYILEYDPTVGEFLMDDKHIRAWAHLPDGPVFEEALRECPFDEPDLSPGKTVSAWRQFVEYAPNRLDWYLVTDKHGAVNLVYWNGTKFEHHAAVIAWAEEPKPYEPKP